MPVSRRIIMSMRKKSHPYSDKGAFPILAEFHHAEDDVAFEKMSDELLAYKSDHGSSGNRGKSRKNKLKNPSGSCTTPHQVGGVGSGDGTCYQKHHDYGTANAGTNGSTKRKEYMKKYRKTKKNDKGVWTPEAGPETGKKNIRNVVPKPFGVSEGHKRASIRVAYLKRELEVERQNLISLASENPQIKSEVDGLLSRVAKHRHTYRNVVKTKRYTKKKPLYNSKGDGCLKSFSEFDSKDVKSYAKELFDKGGVDGGCYQIHHDYGKAPKGDKYQTWYNENVRKYKKKDSSKPYSGEYQGPETGGKTRKKKNREEMIEKAPKWVRKEIAKELYRLKNPPEENKEENKKEETSAQVQQKDKKQNPFAKKKDTSTSTTQNKKQAPKKAPETKQETPTSTTPKKKPRTRGRGKKVMIDT